MTLTLAEQLLLIATHDQKGSILLAGETAVPYGIAGALLLELSMKKRILWLEKRIAVTDRTPTGDPLQDAALELIAGSAKEKDAKYWVMRLPRKIKKINQLVYESLVVRGILTRVEKHFLWVVPYQRYPERDPQPERMVRQNLYDLIRGVVSPDERLLSLLSLVHACGLLNEVVPKGERREAKKTVKEMLAGETVGKAVKSVVEEINVAVMTAVIASSVASTAASS